MKWINILMFLPLLGMSIGSSMLVRAEAVDQALTRVTIVVDGMMKSKSGAT
ncbi:MAG: hypothetical protein ACI9XK_004605 [Granulosicoccus sp.]|jgi:hypothetical protein